jgi:hypothetical protein
VRERGRERRAARKDERRGGEPNGGEATGRCLLRAAQQFSKSICRDEVIEMK